MAAPVAAIIGAAGSIIGGLTGKGKRSKIPGASLVDPRQAAMVNQLQRERQSLKTGTGQTAARTEAAKQTKRFLRNRALAGGRNIADIADYRGRIESAITKGVAEERMGLLGPIVEQKENISKRKMDLLELEKERGYLKKEATGQNLKKNLTAIGGQMLASSGKDGGGENKLGGAIQSILSSFGQGGGGKAGGETGGAGGNIDWSNVANVAGKVIGGIFGGGGGGKE